MKKALIAAGIAGLVASSSVQAAEHVVGTGALALGVGLANAYGQIGLTDTSALTIEYASVSDMELLGSTLSATSVGATYKGYFSKYADGGFWKIGAASFEVTASSDTASVATGSIVLPILTGGYENRLGDTKNVVLGFEGGLGTTAGFGFFNIALGYLFE